MIAQHHRGGLHGHTHPHEIEVAHSCRVSIQEALCNTAVKSVGWCDNEGRVGMNAGTKAGTNEAREGGRSDTQQQLQAGILGGMVAGLLWRPTNL